MGKKQAGLFLFVVVLALLPGKVFAFPGDVEDELCLLNIASMDTSTQGEGTAADCIVHTGLSSLEMRVASVEMQLYPVPDVTQVNPSDEVLYIRHFRRVYAGAPIYDAPNGNILRTMGEGLSLVSYIGEIEGWVQLRQGEWVPIDQTRTYEISSFAGVEIQAPLARPFAWMLAPARPSRYPGGPEYADYPIIERYQLVNIYGIEIVDGWEWYLVGPNQWLQQIRVAKVKPTIRPTEIGSNEMWIAVDLFEQTAIAYQGDRMVYATLISSGLPQWSTEEGIFKIYQRWLYGPMFGSAGYLGDAYYIENVANIMYFNGDMALHAAYWHDKFGYRQSRGCVNLSLMDAYWLYEWTRSDEDTWVYVYSSSEYREDLPDWAVRPQ